MGMPEAYTVDGFDVQMQTNHLSHFLLTSLLLPSLEKAASTAGEARIVNHTSVARNRPDSPFDS
jgi:NAD(P)-dependent dehydrogenase (short-subunit alcohol dehydrogenase family)